MSASGLFKLLEDLAADSDLLEAFYANPDRVLSNYDLTDEQKEMLKTGGEYEYIQTFMAESLKQFSDGGKLGCV